MVKAIQFHRVTPEVQFCGTWNRPGQFEDFIRSIRPMTDIVMPWDGTSGVVITFDDGDASIYEHAFPILKKYGVRAVVFLVAGYIGRDDLWDLSPLGKRRRHLSWNEIMHMKERGIAFGSHTMSHRNLTRLSVHELDYELRESKRSLERRLGKVDCISYPFNRTNNTVLERVRAAGYRFGFGGPGRDDLLIKKEAVYITDNVRSLRMKITERPPIAYRYERIKQQVINYFTITTMLVKG